jgi:hypothetical protein
VNIKYDISTERRMRTYLRIVLILGIFSGGMAFAQTDLSGTWQGKLDISPDQKLTIQFIITKKADGSYAVVLDSPDTGAIKDVAADTVSFKDGTLSLEVKSLSGSYSGVVSKGAITGEWKQPGSAMTLVLKPYEKPKPSSTEPLLGEWVGKLEVSGALTYTAVFRYNKAEDGKFTAFLDIPDQNARGLPVEDVTLAGEEVNFQIPAARGKYRGKLDGEKIAGHFIQGNAELVLDFNKGKYNPPPRKLDVPAEAMKRLKGEWTGKLEFVEGIPLPVRIRFEETQDGKSLAFFDSPNENMKDIPLSDIELKDDKLSLKTTWSGYAGTLKNNSISGHYKLGGMQFELNLTKGEKLEALDPQVDIPADMMRKLSGRWTGKLGNASVIFSFKLNDSGTNEVLIEYPDRGATSTPFLKASIIDGTLSLKTTTAEYRGELKGDKIDGVWRTFGSVTPVPLTKE